jgi:hypothetical protein
MMYVVNKIDKWKSTIFSIHFDDFVATCMVFMCPKLTRLAELVLTIPVSNAWSEKGASKVKIIKTDLRNRLKNDMLEGLMHSCLYTVLQIWQLHWLKIPQKIIQIFNFSGQMMYVVNKIDKWKSTI